MLSCNEWQKKPGWNINLGDVMWFYNQYTIWWGYEQDDLKDSQKKVSKKKSQVTIKL